MNIFKLREAYKIDKISMKNLIIERDPVSRTPHMSSSADIFQGKLIIDAVRLEETIKKACIPVKKRSIVFLNEIPSQSHVLLNKKPPVTLICQARNLNGTPCKCKAKILGKFCMKHAP